MKRQTSNILAHIADLPRSKSVLRILSAISVAAFLGSIESSVSAAESCESKPTIVALSSMVLSDRSSLPKLVARRYGAEAAYLQMKYGALSDQAAAELLQALVAANATDASDLSYAWHIHRDGYAKAVAELGEQEFINLVSTVGISTIRALLLQDGGEVFLMKNIRTTAEMAHNNVGHSIVAAIIDQPDVLKDKAARAAEATGLSFVAADLAASELDPSALNAFLANHKGQPSKKQLIFYARDIPAMVGKPMPKDWVFRSIKDDAAVYSIRAAQALEPEQDFIGLLMNTFGNVGQLSVIADFLAVNIKSGQIRQEGTMDTAWLLVYRSAKILSGEELIPSAFALIPYPGKRYVRSISPLMMSDVIDRLLILESMRPYLKGQSSTLPVPPGGLSLNGRGAWEKWLATASAIRAGSLTAGVAKDKEIFGIVVELLFDKGDLQALEKFILQAPLGEARVAAANDYMLRLDRSCSSYLHRPAEAVMLAGQPRFSFD